MWAAERADHATELQGGGESDASLLEACTDERRHGPG